MTNLLNLSKKFKLSSEIKMVLTEIVVFMLGFVLMNVRFIFGIYPFGLAFVASQRKYTPFAFCGCLLSLIFTMNLDIVYLIALCGLLGLRLVCSLMQRRDKRAVILGEQKQNSLLDSLFCENVEVRVAICAFCAFGIGVYRVVSQNYSYYEIFVLIFFTILSGLLAYTLSLNKKRELPIAYAVLCFGLLYAIRGLELFSLDVSIIIGYALILYVSKHLGAIKAGAFGLILGLCQASAFTPIFSIGGIVSGLLWSISPYLAIMSGFALSVGYGVYAGGYNALISITPELLFVSLIMYPLLRFKMLPVPDFIKENAKGIKSIDTVILESRDKRDKERLSTLTTTFESIAQLIKDASDKSKVPSRMDFSSLCLEACEYFCHSCPKYSICWEKDISTTECNISKLGEELFLNGAVDKQTVEERFLHRCPNIDRIIDKINLQSKERLVSTVKNNKLEVASYDYEQISRLLFSTQSEQIKDEYIDRQLSERLARVCAKIAFECDEIRVIGRQKKQIIATGVNIERTKCTIDTLKRELEKALQATISTPEFIAQGSYATMYATTTNLFKTKELFDSKIKDGEEINGDSFASFDGLGSKRYMLLCDGMGSGYDANITSTMCTSFLKSILSVTGEKEIALAMLNSLIRARGLESSSTIDLLEIDLMSGKGSFVKSGAAPSYIKRGDKVFKLQSKTMPIGIMRDLDAEELSFELQGGDICIMLSDGIVATKDDNEEMMKLIRSHSEENIDTLPKKILEEAKNRSIIGDDMTVCIAQIKKAS